MGYDYLRAVEEIERRYPAERVARSKARLLATWHLQPPPDAIPFMFNSIPMPGGPDRNLIYEARYPRSELLEYLLEQILARSVLDDDYIPSLFPGCRQGLIATACGAREEWLGDHYWTEPLLEHAGQVDTLPLVDLRRQGVAGEFLETIRFFRDATQRRLPIQMPDMQGPLDLAAGMVDMQRLFLDMHDQPEAVHRLLQRMTDDFITYVNLLIEVCEGELVPIHCPRCWLPLEWAMALSEDVLAVISPQLYSHFATPYNEQIAQQFGHIIVHSCGNIEHNLPGLAHTNGLIGVNFGVSETRFERVAGQFGNSAVLLGHTSPSVACPGLPLLSPQQYVDFAFDYAKRRDLRVIANLDPTPDMSPEDCVELCHMARARAQWCN